jgi:hypothetical protein
MRRREPDRAEPPERSPHESPPFCGAVGKERLGKNPPGDPCQNSDRTFQHVRFRRSQNRQEPVGSHYFSPLARAFAVALMIASEVIVALLVASIPATPCRSRIFFGVSVSDE